MINSLDEAIKHCEEKAEELERSAKLHQRPDKGVKGSGKRYLSCLECAKEHQQLAEWLKELKESRMVLDILEQFLVDIDSDVCCDDLMDNEEEQKICEKYCTFKTRGCWIRWAKMKAREVNADANIN